MRYEGERIVPELEIFQNLRARKTLFLMHSYEIKDRGIKACKQTFLFQHGVTKTKTFKLKTARREISLRKGGLGK